MLGRAVDHEAVTDTGYPQLPARLSRVTRMLAVSARRGGLWINLWKLWIPVDCWTHVLAAPVHACQDQHRGCRTVNRADNRQRPARRVRPRLGVAGRARKRRVESRPRRRGPAHPDG